MKKSKLICVLFSAILLTGFVYGKDKSEEKNDIMIKRRVLILDFVNVQKSEDYSYLEKSIPDAILDPLGKTKSFEILSRTRWKKKSEEFGINKLGYNDEESALKIGAAVEADVVVIGNFTAVGSSMQINSRALEMSSGRIMVSKTEVTSLSGEMFSAIGRLADGMASDMKDKLPPLPQRVITQERIKYIEKDKGQTAGISNISGTKKIAFLLEPAPLTLGIYSLQADIGIGNWTHLNLQAGLFELWPDVDFKRRGLIFGGEYRFMITAFNKSIGRTALNGLYIAPAFQYIYIDLGFQDFAGYAIGAEVGHQWVFKNGFTFNIRAGYMHAFTGALNYNMVSTDGLYRLLLGLSSPTIHIDVGWAF